MFQYSTYGMPSRWNKCLAVMIACLLVSQPLALFAAGVSAASKNFKHAAYKKEGTPHFIIYGGEGKLDGVNVKVSSVLVDVFKDSCTDIKETKNYKNLDLYDINDTFDNVLKFWEDKLVTDCFIETTNAIFDQSSSIVKGDEEVKFRSKSMDVNGIGFDADYKNKSIHIRSKVQVVIRVDFFKKDNPGSEERIESQETNDKDVKDE